MNLTFKINKSINTIFNYLTDMQKFVSVHPVIKKIDNVSENNYLVYETLKVGIFPFSFTYPVTINQNFNEKKIVIRATVMKLTKIEMNFTLIEENNFTTINETIIISSPLPLKNIMNSIFRKQHTLLFKNIEALK